MGKRKIRVFHLEDYKIMRDGIKYLLSQDNEVEFVGGAKDTEEFFKVLQDTTVDILLLDIYLDEMEDVKTMTGFEVCERITKDYPDTRIVVHSAYDNADKISKIMKVGAMAFVSKRTGYEELIHAIKTVHSGKKYICTEASKNLKNLNEFLDGIEDTLKPENQFFSNREKEVLELLAKGFSSKDIAKALFITEKTVETHRKNMVEKAKVKNTVELVAYAVGRGFLKT